MPWSLLDIILSLPMYALVLFRIGGMMMTAPVYGSRAIPVRIRAAFAFVVAAMIFPIAAANASISPSLGDIVAGGVAEFMLGASIGLALTFLLVAAEVAGRMVGQQAGLALGQVFDPTQNAQVSTLGQIYSITFVLIFLLAGGHRAVLAAILDSFVTLPLLTFHFEHSVIVLLSEILLTAFALGIRLAGPAVIALFLTTLAMGLLSRTMPQLNILSVGFTVRAMVAVGVAGVALGFCQEPLLNALSDVVEQVRESFGLGSVNTRLVM